MIDRLRRQPQLRGLVVGVMIIGVLLLVVYLVYVIGLVLAMESFGS